MKKISGLKCVNCGKESALAKVRYVCPECSGNLQVVYDYASIRKKLTRKALAKNLDPTIWRYLDALPIRGLKHAVPLQIGPTPLYRSRVLAADFGLKGLFIKDDGRNPSASFKDRAGAIAIARALEEGEKLITGASTGNAASSLACLASVMGLRTIIFVPQSAPVAKIAQLLVFGATVIAVEGNYDQAFDLCLQATAEYGWYNRNTGYNPFTREGKKTCSFELLEQLEWRCPDKVFVPVGDGNIISGIWKGFYEAYLLGLIDRLPKLVAVQAEKSDAIKRAHETDGVIRPVSGETIADSISVSIPRDGQAAVAALRESDGFAISVSDSEVLEAIKVLARAEGVFAEPAAAASIAGLKKAVAAGQIRPGERVVALITGNGLKDVASAMKAVGQPHRIAPKIEDLRRLIGALDRPGAPL
ncbi:MAG: threonine synthase [Bdellovibrionales bacterium RIFOXYD1_FULL_55_31]|nr:MAG: threonine synthase [Bdellovibrionales bacterium RIFOXYD1_FULL_55_31]